MTDEAALVKRPMSLEEKNLREVQAEHRAAGTFDDYIKARLEQDISLCLKLDSPASEVSCIFCQKILPPGSPVKLSQSVLDKDNWWRLETKGPVCCDEGLDWCEKFREYRFPGSAHTWIERTIGAIIEKIVDSVKLRLTDSDIFARSYPRYSHCEYCHREIAFDNKLWMLYQNHFGERPSVVAIGCTSKCGNFTLSRYNEARAIKLKKEGIYPEDHAVDPEDYFLKETSKEESLRLASVVLAVKAAKQLAENNSKKEWCLDSALFDRLASQSLIKHLMPGTLLKKIASERIFDSRIVYVLLTLLEVGPGFTQEEKVLFRELLSGAPQSEKLQFMLSEKSSVRRVHAKW
jgi:hypothetical protein